MIFYPRLYLIQRRVGRRGPRRLRSRDEIENARNNDKRKNKLMNLIPEFR